MRRFDACVQPAGALRHRQLRQAGLCLCGLSGRGGPADLADFALFAHRLWRQPLSELLGLCHQPLIGTDLDTLRDEGLLEEEEYGTIDWGEEPNAVDYGALYTGRFSVLRLAYNRFKAWLPDDYYTFCFWNEDWLEDYALYMTAKGLNKMKAYPEWPAALRTRQPRALEQLREENADELGFWRFLQYQGYRQWMALKGYANGKGVQILGDIPIYVAADSADA